MRILSLLILILSIASCRKSEDHSSADLSKEEMIDILVDMHLAQASLDLEKVQGDSMFLGARKYYATIFQLHEVTEEEFYSSFEYYEKHTDEFHEIYEEVVNRLNELDASTNKDFPDEYPAKPKIKLAPGPLSKIKIDTTAHE